MSKHRINMSFEDRKIELIFRLYVDLADQDYLSARHAYHNGLFHVFYWSSSQSVEKYLKAALLLQDMPAQKQGHDLLELFRSVRQSDDKAILPERLNLPETSAAGRETWQDKPIELFIDYLAQYGSTDNRYGFRGTYVNGPVLHALDLIAYSIRSIMRIKNFTNEDLYVRRSRGAMLHEKTRSDEVWMIDPQMLLEGLYFNFYQVGATKSLRRTFSNMNFAFFKERTAEEHSFGGQHFIGSPLHNHLVRLNDLDESEENRAIVLQMREWASENIKMSPSVRSQLGYPTRKSVRSGR